MCISKNEFSWKKRLSRALHAVGMDDACTWRCRRACALSGAANNPARLDAGWVAGFPEK